MTLTNSLRVLAVALVLTTLSFAAGIAGDLTISAEQRSGQSVVLRIPPELPPDTPRAGPMRAVVQTASAEARPRLEGAPRAESVDNSLLRLEKPSSGHATQPVKQAPKVDPDRAPKDDAIEAPQKGDAPKAG